MSSGYSVLDQSPVAATNSGFGRSTMNQSQLTEIQMELELLKERRRALEQQRKLLLRSGTGGADSAAGAAAAGQPRSSSMTPPPLPYSNAAHQSSTRSSSARSNRSAARSDRSNTSAMDQRQFIASEKERREHVSRNIYVEMKEAMRRSWQSDSTLVGGYFAMNDNPQNSTFSRERRFTNLTGVKGPYYLATEVEEMQRSTKGGKPRHLTASSRGRPGCNVQSNWNDTRGGCAPGPGAYTPRFQKLAKPSILTSRMQ